MNKDILIEEVNNYLNKYKKFMTKDIYITSNMYDTFTNKYKYLYDCLDKNTCEYKNILKIINDKNKLLRKHNRKYVDNKLIKYKFYFDNMFNDINKNIILDKSQREAIICDEDNLLVLSGAGSGKTTTISAKVKYLIDVKNIKPDKICVITFTKKAKEELDYKINKIFNSNVDIYTFHSLGLKIIKYYYKNKDIDIIDEKGQYKIICDYIKNNLFKDKDKFSLFFEAFKNKTSFSEEYKLFDNYYDYHNYMYKRKYINSNTTMDNYIKEQAKRRRNYLKTLNGEYCKSKEEVDIANFLYLNNIDYQYEKSYKKLDNLKIYKPDFYIEQNNNYNYIEHFGIDKVNKTNNHYTKEELTNYLKNMKLKEKYHCDEKIEDLFIITYSKVLGKRNYLSVLKDSLIKKGYVLSKKDNNLVYERLKDTSEDRYINNFVNRIVIPFISYFKRSNYKLDDFKNIKTDNDLLNKQISVISDIYLNYESKLRAKNLIDFEDMINISYKVMPYIKEKNLGVDYKYIIIDEYQDVSMQRFNLTKRIEELFKSKIIAFGDDYQTIFGFSGSRIDLMTEFRNYLSDAKQIPIPNVYRNSQELIDVATKFINKNSKQIKKKLISNKRLINPIELYIYNDSNYINTNINKSIILSNILDKIYLSNNKSNVLLLERYNNDIDTILNNNLFIRKNHENIIYKKHEDMKIDYLTIHKSKGLEYDNCILINAIDDKYGFPSKIEDEEIIKLLKPKIEENIFYPEERRLFYVAMTRTKNKLYILVPKSKTSSFIREIESDKNVLIKK
ncbi:uvrD/REP helicase [Clostridium sp. CAG:762]|nr:uvrD/REP helicase [Clostridium sp. CAG:762]